MTKRITFLFLLFSSLSFAQTPTHGKYCVKNSSYHQVTCLELKDDGTFIYSEGDNLMGVKNHFGSFVIQGNLLILNYKNQHSKPLSYHRSRIWRNDNDSVTVKINVFDIQGKPLPHIFISRSGNRDQIGLPPSFEETADLKFLKITGREQITTGFVGFENYWFEIDLNYDHIVDVFLAESPQLIPIRDQIDSLRVSNVKIGRFESDDEPVWIRKD